MLKLKNIVERVAEITGLEKIKIKQEINSKLNEIAWGKGGYEAKDRYRKKLTVKIVLNDILTQCRKCGCWNIRNEVQSFALEYDPNPVGAVWCGDCGETFYYYEYYSGKKL